MDIFNRTQTYESDKPLFRELGLEDFNIACLTEYFVGSVILDNGSEIKLYVEGYPAQFWTAIVESNGQNKKYKVGTGSGRLSDYWHIFKALAEDMLNIEVI